MEKQPTQQSLEACGLAIGRRVAPTRTSTRPVSAPADQVTFGLVEEGVKARQRLGLGIGAHRLDHLLMERLGPGGVPTALQALVEFPDRIPQPG